MPRPSFPLEIHSCFCRHITKFNFLRRDGKPVNQTRHIASLDQKVAYISMSWSPNNDDLGHHIVCANAEDSAGSAEFICDLMNRFKKKEKRAKKNPSKHNKNSN